MTARRNHSKPTIRKRTILLLYSLILHHPEALTTSWHRLISALSDPDPAVVSATVNVVCELGRRYPKRILALSPQLFELLTSSTNNWMLIKIVKVFGYLSPHEPRLVRKLLPPIKAIIETTPALSLLYECINSVISGDMLAFDDGTGSSDQLAEACVDKLAAFLEDDEDRNLKYVALLSLVRILPTHPHLVARYQDVILDSIDEDDDLSIRLRALDLAAGMATRGTLRTIVERLMVHLDPDASSRKRSGRGTSSGGAAAALRKALTTGPSGASASTSASPTDSTSFRLEVAHRILSMGATNTYAHIDDFEWYIGDVILPLLRSSHGSPGIAEIARDQIVDVAMRVRAVRPFAVEAMERLLGDPTWAMADGGSSSVEDLHTLYAAAWVVGEYHEFVSNPRIIVDQLLPVDLLRSSSGDDGDDSDDDPSESSARATTLLACLQGSVKLFAHWAASLSTEGWNGSRLDEVANVAALLADKLASFVDDPRCEVAERVKEFAHLFEFLLKDLEGAQKKVADDEAEKKGQKKDDKAEESPKPAATAAPLPLPPADESTAHWGESAAMLNLTSSSSGSSALASTSSSSQPRGPKSLHLLSPLFSPAPMGPVGSQAQKKVPPPKDVDFKAPLCGEWEVVLPPQEKLGESSSSGKKKKESDGGGDAKAKKRSKKQSGKGKSKSKDLLTAADDDEDDDLDDVPIVQLSLADLPSLAPPAAAVGTEDEKGKKAKTKKKPRVREEDLLQEEEEMPPGAAAADEVAAKEDATKAAAKQGNGVASTPSSGDAAAVSGPGKAVEASGAPAATVVTKSKKKKPKDEAGTGAKTKIKKSRRAAADVVID